MKYYFLFMCLILLHSTILVCAQETAEYSTISVKFIGIDKSISCQEDNSTHIYVCPSDLGHILVTKKYDDFIALGRGADKSTTRINIEQVHSTGKLLYAGTDNSSDDISSPKNIHDLIPKIEQVDSFFGINLLPNGNLDRTKGSAEFEKIASDFISENENNKEKIKSLYSQKNYTVTLDNGKKINCERETPPNSKATGDYANPIQCNFFNCDKVMIDGVEYDANLLYAPNTFTPSSVQLIDKNGIAPHRNILKITSEKSSIPIEDYSDRFDSNDIEEKNSIEEALPKNLERYGKSIALYRDDFFNQSITSNIKDCSKDDESLSRFISAKDKLLEKVANLELSEFIQILADGTIISQYLDKSKAASLRCYYDGVYLNNEAAKNLNLIDKNLHIDERKRKSISMNKANELFKEALSMKDINWQYKKDGCFARAHLMARRFEAEGVEVDKVWLKGALYIPGTDINWNYHVAPIVYVKDADGVTKKMVIDPALFDRPVSVEEWDKKIAKKTKKGSVITSFPFPDNAAEMERSSISFSTSNPFSPDENIRTTEKEKMQFAIETMEMYRDLGDGSGARP